MVYGLVDEVAVVIERGDADQRLAEQQTACIKHLYHRGHAHVEAFGKRAVGGEIATEITHRQVLVGYDAAHDDAIAIIGIAAHGDEEFVERDLAIGATVGDKDNEDGVAHACGELGVGV